MRAENNRKGKNAIRRENDDGRGLISEPTIEPLEPAEIDAPRVRYHLTKEYRKARLAQRPGERAVLDDLVERYRQSGDEKEVTATVRQIAEASGVSPATVARSLNILADKGFIVITDKGSYDVKRKPSRYRLTMFPCRGQEPLHDYIEDPKAWRRQRRPKAFRPKPKTVRISARVKAENAAAVLEQIDGFIVAN